MDNSMSSLLKKLSQYESEISSILGMLVVAALAVFIFLFVKKFMPKPSITPLAENTQSAEDLMKQAGAAGTYTVKAGQGLSQIAKEALGDGKAWVKIAKANDLKAPYTLEKGQVLKLPEGSLAQADMKAVDTTMVKTDKPSVKDTQVKIQTATPATSTYIVTKGDSLWKIAVAQYGTGYAWTRVYNANRKLIGKNPGKLFVGTSLVMPSN